MTTQAAAAYQAQYAPQMQQASYQPTTGAPQAAPMQQTMVPPPPGQGKMQFVVMDPQSGQEQVIDDSQVFHSLQQMGANPVGISPDGTRITLQDQQGPYEVEIDKIFQQHGYEVGNMMPAQPVYDYVDAGMRHAVMKLPDDDSRRAYLSTQMQKRGIELPIIVGTGRDWSVFNPETNDYIAITNSPDIEMADFAEAASTVGRMGLGAVGGMLGSVGGPLGAAAGYAGGATLADVGERALLGYLDPEYAEAAPWEAHAADVGQASALDAALGVGGAYAGPALRTALSPFSTATKGIGRGLQTAGDAVGGAGRVLQKPFVKETATYVTPGVGEAATAGWLGQLPQQAITGPARLMGWAGRSRSLREHAPGMAGRMEGMSQQLLRQRAGKMNLAEEMAAKMGGGPAPRPDRATASDVLGNIGEMMQRGQTRKGYGMAREYGIPAQDAMGIGRQFAEESLMGKIGGRMQGLGGGIDDLANVGLGLEKAAIGTTGIAARGLQGLGGATSGIGKGLRTTGTLTQPIETRGLGQFLSEEAQLGDWQNRGNRRRLMPNVYEASLY